MKTYQVPPINKPVRKQILYWQAKQGKTIIDTNNSIAILIHKYSHLNLTYHAIR